MAHLIRNVLAAAVIAGGVYVLYTKAVEADPDFDLQSFSLSEIDYDSIKEMSENVSEGIGQEIDKPDYEIDENDMFDEGHDILEGDVPLCVIDDIQADTKLDVEIGGCVFRIDLSGDNSFRIQAENMGKYQCYVEEGTLVLKGTGAVADFSDMKDINIKKSELVLYIPKGYVFPEAELELDAGSMEIESISAAKLKLECGAGAMDVKYADTEAGELKCSAGRLDVGLFGVKSDYNYTIKSAVGTVQIGDESYSGVTTKQDIRNNAEKEIELECTMGSIRIAF